MEKFNNFSEYIIEKIGIEVSKNVKDVMESVKNGSNEYDYRIKKYIEKHNLKDDEILKIKELIKENYYVASLFFKEPSRQNISEVYAYKYIKDNLNLESMEFIKLKSSGKGNIRFDIDGNKVEDAVINNNLSKSVDFKLVDGNVEYYITQKFTKESGGHQDNQYKDVIDFLDKGSKSHNVIALVDGDYWYNKINKLKDVYKNNDNVRILTVFEFVDKFKKIRIL